MKNSLARTSLLVFAALGAFTAAALAGPGPQYWKSPARTPAAASAPKTIAPAPACAGCKTEPVLEFAPSLPNGKGTPRWTVVGSRHDCAGCGGSITTVRGQTRDTMNRVDSACAKSGVSCCR